jgi:hypothetical protein
MTQSRKYRSFGVRRSNNLSDIQDKTASLNNLLNNLPGTNPPTITFISEDLDAIRGLKDTNIRSDSFIQIGQTAPKITLLDEQDNPVEVLVDPLVRLEDRFNQFRTVTDNPPVFASGQGPRAYFIRSNLIPTFTANTNITTDIEPVLSDPSIQISDDFWMLGEFVINDRLRVDFADSFGGILWEGFYIPNPSASIHTFFYETSGLFHAEYDRFGTGNWQVLKSIYAKKRDVVVATNATSSTIVVLESGESRYISIGDFWEDDDEAEITNITGDTITLTKEVTVTTGQTMTFDMPLGEDTTSGSYTINEILDRDEVPQMKLRIFWWFPDVPGYDPVFKYLRNRISGRTVFDYFFLNQTPASVNATPGSIRELLETAVTPSKETMGSTNNYRSFKSSKSTDALYIPKSALSEITKVASVNITFKEGNRSVTGSFSATEIGNVIVPTTAADLGPVVPKNMRIKDLLGSNVASTARLVNQSWPVDRTSYSVRVIDHNGLIDYFVGTSSTNTVTVSDTSRLRPDMICITGTTSSSDFVRITKILSSTQFETSDNLSITDQYVFVYANAGIIDRSLDVFCVNVFGQVLASTANSGTNTLSVVSATGIENGQVVQFGNSIPAGTTVTNVSGTTITLSDNLTQTINQDETIVFAPAGTTVNKEICVLPLDLSPPFIGIDTGLSTDGKNIRSSETDFNLKVVNLEFRNATVNTASISETYDRLISIQNDSFAILANLITESASVVTWDSTTDTYTKFQQSLGEV